MATKAVTPPRTNADTNAGIGLALTGALALSLKAIFVKLAFSAGASAIFLTTLRMAIALPIVLVLAARASARINKRTTREDWFAVVGLGIVGNYVAGYLDFLGLAHVSAGIERVVLFLYPTLVIVLATAIDKRRFRFRDGISLALSYGGVILVCAGQKSSAGQGDNPRLGIALVFASAVAYAGYLFFSKRYIDRMGSMWFSSYGTAAASLVACIVGFPTGGFTAGGSTSVVWFYAAFLAVVCTVLPTLATSAAIRRIGPSSVGLIGTVGPTATLILAAVFLGESVTAVQAIGVILVIVGSIALNTGRAK